MNIGSAAARPRKSAIAAIFVVVGVLLATFGVIGLRPASAADQSITSAGPLTNITISDELNCAVNHTGDETGEWFGSTACGTFISYGGHVYGPSDVPAGDDATGSPDYIAFTPVSQSAVTGDGSAGNPFSITTVVQAGTGVRLTETDTYQLGFEQYQTDVSISNTSGVSISPRLYRAGDCFLQDSDKGYGKVDGSTVSCRGVTQDSEGNDIPGDRLESLIPLTSGSHHYEAGYSQVWAVIGAQSPFDDTCRCTEEIDNGAGLSWDLAAIANGGSTTVSNLSRFSPRGLDPLVTTKTADQGTVEEGAADGYTITVTNGNTEALAVQTITDDLPAGFTYTPGSTTGATTSNPTISGQHLTWSGPFNAPASGTLTLHFAVTASSTPGTYTNVAGGTASTSGITSTGATAPVTVTAPTSTTTSTSTSTTTSTSTSTTSTSTSSTSSTSTTSTTSSTTSTSTSTTTTLPTTTTTISGTTTTCPVADAGPPDCGGTTTLPTLPPTSTTAPSTTTTTSGSTTTTTTPPGGTSCTDTTSTAHVTPSSVNPGAVVDVTDGCFAPGATLSVTFESTPVSLGSTVADGNGVYDAVEAVPLGTVPGTHHIVVVGPGPGGQTHTSTATFTVNDLDCSSFKTQADAQRALDANKADPYGLDGDHDGKACEALASASGGGLPRTGPPLMAPMLLLAGFAFLAGGQLLLASVRREERSTLLH